MPIVRADLPQGLSDENKEALRQAIKAADPYLLFRETPAESHYRGGTPLPNWAPADG